jgi:probable H4MPT-linked C1 transfer pathway protein
MIVTPQVAITKPLLAAASNWHALARFCGRYTKPGAAILIDVGSTTTDIIPILDGVPATVGHTDTERLLSGELVYTGVERTPVCALLRTVSYRGQACPIATEMFATTRDAYTILGDLAEDAGEKRTADGRPATKAFARARLGRLVCADEESFNHRDAAVIAESITDVQTQQLMVALNDVMKRLPSPPAKFVLSGHGEFLARRALETLQLSTPIVSLARELRPNISRCAPAHALAVIAREAVGG